jgi:hypothetical protein
MRIIHLANRHHDEPSAGHGYWLNHAYKNSCIENGADFIIVAPVKSLDPEAFAVLKLDSESRARLTFFPLIGLQNDLRSVKKLMSEDDQETILHIYEGGLRELLLVIGLKRELEKLKVVFNFNLSDPWHIALASKNSTANGLWKLLSKTIEPLQGSVSFTAETKELADLLMQKLDIPIAEYQLPALVPIQDTPQAKRDWDFFIPVFGPEEFALVSDALEISNSEAGTKNRVLIQPKWNRSLTQEAVSKIENLGGKILSAVLTQDEYVDFVSHSKVIVLPYKNTDYYLLQSSGRMVDAVALGARVIVPESTSLSRRVQENDWGVSFDVNSPENLATAMEASLKGGVLGSATDAKVLNPYQSIKSQIPGDSGAGRALIQYSMQVSKQKTALRLTSLLFLFSDFRSFISGIVGFVGLSSTFQARIAKLLPRK